MQVRNRFRTLLEEAIHASVTILDTNGFHSCCDEFMLEIHAIQAVNLRREHARYYVVPGNWI